MRDIIGGSYEARKSGRNTTIKFFHKGENVKHSDAVKVTLELTPEDIKKI